MLSKMRKYQRSLLIYIFFAIIIAVFVLYFGPGNQGCSNTSKVSAAKVNGQAIPSGDFEFAYTRMYKQYQSRFPKFDLKMAQSMNLRQTVLNNLIERELLSQKAIGYDLDVNDKELAESIEKIDSFKTSNKFDFDLYKKLVNYYYQTSLSNFEDSFRKELLAQKMKNLITENIHISAEEVEKEYRFKEDQRKLSYVKFSWMDYKNNITSVTEEEIKKYLEESLKDIEEYYNKNKYKYNTQKEVKASHILIKLEEEATVEKEKEIKTKAERILKEVKESDKDFSHFALMYSEDEGSKVKGGDLGFFKRGRMVKPFEDKVFSLKKGDLSDLVKTRYGFHIIKVIDIKEPVSKELELVKNDIAKELIEKNRAKDEAKKVAEGFIEQLKAEGATFDKVFESKAPFEPEPGKEDIKLKKTGFFGRDREFISGIGMSKEIRDEAFNFKVSGETKGKIYEVRDNYYLIALAETKEPDMKKFGEEKTKLIQEQKQVKSREFLTKWMEQERTAANIEQNPAVLLYDNK